MKYRGSEGLLSAGIGGYYHWKVQPISFMYIMLNEAFHTPRAGSVGIT